MFIVDSVMNNLATLSVQHDNICLNKMKYQLNYTN